MSETIENKAINKLSTYEFLFAKNILQYFNVSLTEQELLATLQDKTNVYYNLLTVPYKNVFNGIILEQAQDYRIFTQKLFIDYFLSGANDVPADSPGADTRDSLEHERLNFIDLGKQFDSTVINHEKLIADTQMQLIQLHDQLLKNHTVLSATQLEDFTLTMKPYADRADAMKKELYNYRNQFYARILRVRSILQIIPDYIMDEEKIAQHQVYLGTFS